MDRRRKIVQDMLTTIGEDPSREGLVNTPIRVVKSWEKLYGGYKQDPSQILSTTFKEAENYDQMIWLTDIPFFSSCEHHMLPFFGVAHLAYIPGEDQLVVGASKLARLVECYARRLQIQERMTRQIADAVEKYLKPKGCGTIVIAQHFCMTARGIEKEKVRMKTSAIRGLFYEKSVKEEFIQLCLQGGI